MAEANAPVQAPGPPAPPQDCPARRPRWGYWVPQPGVRYFVVLEDAEPDAPTPPPPPAAEEPAAA